MRDQDFSEHLLSSALFSSDIFTVSDIFISVRNIVFDTISEVTTNTHTVKPRYFKLDGTEKKLPKYPRIRDIEGKIFNK